MNTKDGYSVSRRQLVGGVGAGPVAAAATPAFAQSAPAKPTAQPLQDPTTKYPKPRL